MATILALVQAQFLKLEFLLNTINVRLLSAFIDIRIDLMYFTDCNWKGMLQLSFIYNSLLTKLHNSVALETEVPVITDIYKHVFSKTEFFY